MNLKDIGHTLKSARVKKNITIERIFKKTHIHPDVLNAIEEGTVMDTLAKPYARAFLKKYADFLGMNSKQILRDFDALHLKDAEQALELGKKNIFQDKRILWVLPGSAIITIIFIIFAVLLGLRIGSALIKKAKTTAVKTESAAKTQKITPRLIESGEKSSKKAVKKEKPFVLTLRAREDVWIRVTKDGQKVFEGILPTGSVEKWQADERLEIRSGKTEVLEFILDDKSRGIIGEGVKNIAVTKDSIEIR